MARKEEKRPITYIPSFVNKVRVKIHIVPFILKSNKGTKYEGCNICRHLIPENHLYI